MSDRRQPTPEDLLGPLESVCMRSLWRSSPATVRDVLGTVHDEYDPELAYTTVMTVLQRLHDKGLVRREHVGRGHRYEPVHSQQELIDLLGRREVDELVDRYGDVALAHFAETLRDIDPSVLAKIQDLAEGSDRA